MVPPHPGERPPPGSGTPPVSRPTALIPLLVVFGVTVLGIVVVLLLTDPYHAPEGAPADQAFGPADFPTIFARDEALAGLADADPQDLFPVPAPPFRDPDIFPCLNCHADLEPDPERRELVMFHDEIVLRHDEEHRWCLDCHDRDNRDHLRLASGELVEFTESYRLCGQCHGTQYRDWRAGIHGLRTGYWDGPKRYLLCVHCHDPHTPRYEPMEPLPPPIRPQFLRTQPSATEPTTEG